MAFAEKIRRETGRSSTPQHQRLPRLSEEDQYSQSSRTPQLRSLSPMPNISPSRSPASRSLPGQLDQLPRLKNVDHESPTHHRFPKEFAATPSPAAARSVRERLVGVESKSGDEDHRHSSPNSRIGSSKRRNAPTVAVPKLEAEPIVSPQFDKSFKKKLAVVSERNDVENIERVMEARMRLEEAELERIAREGEKGEARRLEAQLQYERITRERKISDEKQRAMLWGQLLLTAFFLLKVHHNIRVHHAMDFLSDACSPMVRRHLMLLKKKAQQNAYTTQRLPNNPRPTAEFLCTLKGGFFMDWGDAALTNLIQNMVPRSYREGQVIMHDGDFDREMYILMAGEVDILIRNKESGRKQRSRSNSSAIFRSRAPTYFGEFALLCMEPRSATIVCATPSDLWVVYQSTFADQLQNLPAEIKTKLEATTNTRRKDNLRNYFPLRLSVVQDLPMFSSSWWRVDLLQQMIDTLDPVVVGPKTVLFREGDAESDAAMYIVGEGTVRLQRTVLGKSEETDISAGQCFGEFEAFFGQERRSCSAETVTHTDLWAITRKQILDIAIANPDSILASREVLRSSRAAQMLRPMPPPFFFSHDPFIASCALPPTFIHHIWANAVPDVRCANEYLFKAGEEANRMYAVVAGSLNVRFANKVWADLSESVAIVPKVGLTVPGDARHEPVVSNGVQYAHPIQVFSPHLADVFLANPSDASTKTLQHSQSRRGMMALSSPSSHKAAGVGLLFGAFEFSSRDARYASTVKALSICEIWRIDVSRKVLEANLVPQQIAAFEDKSRIRAVVDAYNNRNIAALQTQSAQRKHGKRDAPARKDQSSPPAQGKRQLPPLHKQ